MSGNGGARRATVRKRISGNGGARRAALRERTSGDRAVVRWAWRLFRRDWRQQIMALALLTVAVTTAVVGVSAGYHATPPAGARFGDAGQRIEWYGDGNPQQDTQIAQAREWFGTADMVRRWYLPVPASAKTVEVRAQDPGGPYGGPMLRLLTGRFPAAPGEVAVTDEVVANLRASAGGRNWTVVGTVENPGALQEEFALVTPTEATTARLGRPQAVTLLTAADPKRFAEYRARHPQLVYASRPSYAWVEAAAGVFSAFAVSLLLVALIASAGFAVVAHRRLRQLGLFAAIGATPRHLRLVLLANGAAVGAAASVLGVATGVLVWFAVTPRFETAAGHRIARLDLPWWQIAAALLLAVLAATVAAWRPARAAARVPITLALSARPPRPRRVHRSAAAAALLVAPGVAALRVAQRNTANADALGLGDCRWAWAGPRARGRNRRRLSPRPSCCVATASIPAASARPPTS
ncbi:FtsX-like permease family protein [Pseudosporangium ferrugineum]|nr:FtsX-like permease family protein [Pseudosporangium ferrugineum]